MPTVKLRAGDAVATVEPDHGGRVGQITVGGQRLLVDVPVARDPLLWGAYPMAPWAGRLRNGRFCFAGVEYQMPLDHRDDADPVRHHAIHGLLYRRRWPPGDATAMSWGARLDLDWPLGGEVLETITLEADRLTLTLEVRSTGAAFPAVVGWHPWFRAPDSLAFAPTAMYERSADGLPTGRLGEPSAPPWDDCFVAAGPVELHYARRHAPVVTISADCDHWVIYDHPADATCVEPQSGPPDAFNLDLPTHVVGPDAPLRRTFTIAW
jgi:aldose 1-epimerase